VSDKEFLTWIYERLKNVHGESPFVDYMYKLKDIIERFVEVDAQREQRVQELAKAYLKLHHCFENRISDYCQPCNLLKNGSCAHLIAKELLDEKQV